MGIRLSCPNGHKLHVKDHLAGKRGICPHCGAKVDIPLMQAADAEPGGVTHAAMASRVVTVEAPASRISPSEAPAPSPDFASQSIIIEVSEASAPQVSLPADDSVPPVDIAAIASPPAPPDGSPPPTPLPAYVLKRQRSRQNQLILAVILLVAVLVLGIVLVWVLSRGPTVTPKSASRDGGDSSIIDAHDPLIFGGDGKALATFSSHE